jgi:transcription elongation factor Elf1
MSIALDKKYILLLSSHLRNFKRKKANLFVFSCPICNDSETDKRKARGNIFLYDARLTYHCYNCSASMSASNFIKSQSVSMYDEYMREKMLDNSSFNAEFIPGIKRPTYIKSTPLDKLVKIYDLDKEHHARLYVESRLIPLQFHSSIYYCPKFFEFINNHVEKDKFSSASLKMDHDRLIFPLIDKSGDMHGLQGRSFKADDPTKYITILTNDSIPKLYGLDRVNFNAQIPVTEGPIDSLFLPNALSSCGGNIISALSGFDKDKFVVVYDNECRKKESLDKIEQAIDRGYKVLLYPKHLKQKDINAMVISGELDQLGIDNMLKNNVYCGLVAKMKFSEWRKL